MSVNDPTVDTEPEIPPDPVSMEEWEPQGMWTTDQAATHLGVSGADIAAMADRGEIHRYTWPRGTWYAPNEIMVIKEARDAAAAAKPAARMRKAPDTAAGAETP